jgi:hypothetical protein
VRFIGACARAIMMVVSGIIKVLGVIVGVAIIIASSLAMAAASVAAVVMAFGIQSPYMQSDLPLHELVGNPKYYIAILAAYLVVIFPLVFVIQIGGVFVTRRNQFKTSGIIAMTVIWFAALSTMAAMGTQLAPWAQARLAEVEATQTITQDVALSGEVTTLLLSGNADLSVTRGDVASLKIIGREEGVGRTTTTVENGQLRMDVSRSQERNGLCLFCHRRTVRAELVIPELTTVEVRDRAYARLEGFGNLELTAEDSAHVRAKVEDAETVRVTQSDNTQVTLEGVAKSLFITLEDAAHLFANDLHAEVVEVTAMDYGRVYVRTSGTLTATAHDMARILSRGNPATSTIQELDYGRVTDGYEE